jgi:hypothetical protein
VKTGLLVSSWLIIALLAKAQDPAPRATPIPTPRVIILYHEQENFRKSLEKDRAGAEKSYDSGTMNRNQYDKSMKEYKEGIDKYRRESKDVPGSGDRAKTESKSEPTSREKKESNKK